jgi:hypothetical protein
MPSRIRITNIDEHGRINVRIVRQGMSEPEALRSEFELEPGAAKVITLYSDCAVVIAPESTTRFPR